MNDLRNGHTPPAPRKIRCAVYTRKSTEEGLDQDFNSLDAQRESAEAYIRSQAGEGWICHPDRYDDGGFSGGDMDRPALTRLRADIEAGRVDCVVVYKVDRLSRSLLDFAKMMETFEKHNVSFVSVTQQFNTATSMGRLILNVLLSFAQFEREIISERTRDKMAAARRKGKWMGGLPPLGFDVDPVGPSLVVNEDEAARVRGIFELYLEHEALIPVVRELKRRGWYNKRWVTKKGRETGGKPFYKQSLHALLTNVVYIGKVRHKDEVYDGRQEALVDEATWRRVQATLERNGRSGGAPVRNQFGALLKGILRCGACDCAMSPTHTKKAGNRRYRYYVCCQAQRAGWDSCPSKSIPAAEIERVVVDEIQSIAKDTVFLREVVAEIHDLGQTRLQELDAERQSLQRQLYAWNVEVHQIVGQLKPGDVNGPATAKLADLQERIRIAERRTTEVREEALALGRRIIDPGDVTQAMAIFDPLWISLTSCEQARAIQLLVQRVEYNGATGKVAITFHPAGIKALADQLAKGDAA